MIVAMANVRNLAVDYIKVFAIIAVVFCHIYPKDYFGDNMRFIGLFGATGVPLFLMCTGVLMLNRDYGSRDRVTRFYRKNFLTLLVTSCLWYVIYMFVIQHESLSIELFIKTLFFINKPTPHLWYLRMILIYYAVLPLMVYIRKRWTAVYYIVMLAVVGFVFAKTTIMLLNCEEYPTVSGLSMLVYWGYMEFGRCLSNMNKCKSKYVMYLVEFFAVVSYVSLSFILKNREHLFLWYDNIFVAGISLGVFVLLTQVASAYKTEMMTTFAKQSFGIYLIHVLWLMFIWNVCLADAEINDTIKVCLEVVFALSASTLSIVLIGKCKPLARLLFRS